MILIQSTTVSGTATTSVTFSSIPQDGTHLVVVGSARSATADTVSISYGRAGTGYSLNATSGGMATGAFPNNTIPGFFGGFYGLFPNYAGTAVQSGLSDATTPATNLSTRSAYNSTTAGSMGSITITGSRAFADQSRFAIYKITAGTGGATFS